MTRVCVLVVDRADSDRFRARVASLDAASVDWAAVARANEEHVQCVSSDLCDASWQQAAAVLSSLTGLRVRCDRVLCVAAVDRPPRSHCLPLCVCGVEQCPMDKLLCVDAVCKLLCDLARVSLSVACVERSKTMVREFHVDSQPSDVLAGDGADDTATGTGVPASGVGAAVTSVGDGARDVTSTPVHPDVAAPAVSETSDPPVFMTPVAAVAADNRGTGRSSSTGARTRADDDGAAASASSVLPLASVTSAASVTSELLVAMLAKLVCAANPQHLLCDMAYMFEFLDVDMEVRGWHFLALGREL